MITQRNEKCKLLTGGAKAEIRAFYITFIYGKGYEQDMEKCIDAVSE